MLVIWPLSRPGCCARARRPLRRLSRSASRYAGSLSLVMAVGMCLRAWMAVIRQAATATSMAMGRPAARWVAVSAPRRATPVTPGRGAQAHADREDDESCGDNQVGAGSASGEDGEAGGGQEHPGAHPGARSPSGGEATADEPGGHDRGQRQWQEGEAGMHRGIVPKVLEVEGVDQQHAVEREVVDRAAEEPGKDRRAAGGPTAWRARSGEAGPRRPGQPGRTARPKPPPGRACSRPG